MNDNAPDSSSRDEALREQVQAVFDEFINPALQGHGGFARLQKVENGNVYVELGGGCRGCPGARMTMRQGIETAIRDRVSGIESVVDVTDHAAG